MKAKCVIIGLVVFLLGFYSMVTAEISRNMKFGFFADRTLVSTQTIVFNQTLNRRINEIGNRIAQHSDRPDASYTFRIINDPTINAYSAAEGFIYVTTGLLDILESEEELAAVLAHEIGHVSKNHQINFIYAAHRRQIAGQVTGAFLGAALGTAMGAATQSAYGSSYYNNYYSQSYTQQAIDLGRQIGEAIGNAMYVSMVKGYGRKQELQADALAIQYSKNSGYNPHALISVFQKLISIRDRLGLSKTSYLSSLINAEPGLEERVKQVESLNSTEEQK